MKQKNIKFRCTEKFKTDVEVIAKQWGFTVSEYLTMLVYKDMGYRHIEGENK